MCVCVRVRVRVCVRERGVFDCACVLYNISWKLSQGKTFRRQLTLCEKQSFRGLRENCVPGPFMLKYSLRKLSRMAHHE